MGKRNRGKPQGATYAEVLARKRQIAAAVNAAARDESVQLISNVRCQRQLWMAAIALNEEYGFGGERIARFLRRMTKVVEEWEKIAGENDMEYANEKLRERAEQVTGIKIEYLYESELRKAREMAKRDGIALDPMEV